jgi:hypothetical protein
LLLLLEPPHSRDLLKELRTIDRKVRRHTRHTTRHTLTMG